GQLMNDFKAKSVRPDDIDMVVMTHLHRDHVGWNLKTEGGKYVPTFPRARYWMPKKDWDSCHDPALQPTRFVNAPQCVWPLADLGLVEFMNGEQSLTRELTAVPTPGHTPGHMSILVTSKGERALVLGDAAHSPVQVLEPDWVSRADMDPDLTRQTRKALLDRLEREQILVAAGHFAAPAVGRIVRLEGRRYPGGLGRAERRAPFVDVRERVVAGRQLVRQARARRQRHVEIERLGRDALHRPVDAAGLPGDHARPHPLAERDLRDLARRNVLIA